MVVFDYYGNTREGDWRVCALAPSQSKMHIRRQGVSSTDQGSAASALEWLPQRDVRLWIQVYGAYLDLCYAEVERNRIEALERRLIRMWNPEANVQHKR